MKQSEDNARLVSAFLEEVWNTGGLDRLDEFVHPDYRDNSLPEGFPKDRSGLELWIRNTSKAFEHRTIVESLVADEQHVAVRLSFEVRHTGAWRGIAPTFRSVTVKGFRYFEVEEGKIKSHWALIDGEGLHAALTEKPQGCALPQQVKP
ncbi:MAG: hypothetical protein EOO15_24465 [Chitinophagaceae bacterium]|nr:MAG: hypothetical protein EOO15_24465 [Chitinophagaceae bacterium]